MSLEGVDPDLADYIEQAAVILAQAAPGVSLKVVSGYRDPAYQAELRRRWDRGQRGGLLVRPAANSQHTQGRAVDIAFSVGGQLVPVRDTPREYWEFLDELLRPVGVRWGGRFRPPDLNHFEL